ncbi:hypothetical protein U1Q18_035192, partial [Sarracenia purpurea var. burkii]
INPRSGTTPLETSRSSSPPRPARAPTIYRSENGDKRHSQLVNSIARSENGDKRHSQPDSENGDKR